MDIQHDTIPRVKNVYCFYEKLPQNVLHYRMEEFSEYLEKRSIPVEFVNMLPKTHSRISSSHFPLAQRLTTKTQNLSVGDLGQLLVEWYLEHQL